MIIIIRSNPPPPAAPAIVYNVDWSTVGVSDADDKLSAFLVVSVVIIYKYSMMYKMYVQQIKSQTRGSANIGKPYTV